MLANEAEARNNFHEIELKLPLPKFEWPITMPKGRKNEQQQREIISRN